MSRRNKLSLVGRDYNNTHGVVREYVTRVRRPSTRKSAYANSIVRRGYISGVRCLSPSNFADRTLAINTKRCNRIKPSFEIRINTCSLLYGAKKQNSRSPPGGTPITLTVPVLSVRTSLDFNVVRPKVADANSVVRRGYIAGVRRLSPLSFAHRTLAIHTQSFEIRINDCNLHRTETNSHSPGGTPITLTVLSVRTSLELTVVRPKVGRSAKPDLLTVLLLIFATKPDLLTVLLLIFARRIASIVSRVT